MAASGDYFSKLQKEVVNKGICSHCGTCVGLAPKSLGQEETINGPLPKRISDIPVTDKKVYSMCPVVQTKYHELNKSVFNKPLKDYLLGNFEQGYIGYSEDDKIRRAGGSGGVTTHVLCYLLKTKQIQGAIVLKQGTPKPWQAKPIIATTEKQIRACSQSVYIPVMVNAILAEAKKFKGKLAFVGLPDQVAAIRKLQKAGDPTAKKIVFIIGPYTGTAIYAEALASYLRANGVKEGLDAIKTLKYRDGEWPGYLRIDTKDGQTFKSPKFYYNYLIPFYVTTASQLMIDFTNELCDISVGDAWHPKYEEMGKGFSVLIARSKKANKLLKEMEKKKLLHLEKTTRENMLNMHGHMIDFKKRGSFIRAKWRKNAPNYDYKPKSLKASRYAAESFIAFSFWFGRTKFARWLVEHMPLSIVGPTFNVIRKSWKGMSKSTKRKGISHQEYIRS